MYKILKCINKGKDDVLMAVQINLQRTKEKLLEWLSDRDLLETRLYEKSFDDIEYFQHGIIESSELTNLLQFSGEKPEQTVISLLRQLESEGLVQCDEQVSLYDSSEYHVVWTLPNKVNPIDE